MKVFIDSQKIIPTISSSMTFSEFVQGFLANLDHELGMLISELGNVSGGRVLGRQLSILCDYLDLKYREGGSSKSEAEMLVEHNINKRPSNWDSLFRQYVREPFVACLRNSGREEFIGIHERLSGIIRALNAKELEKMVFGGQRPTDRTMSYVVDFYGLSPIEYVYRTFKDPQLETFYSNDGIKIPKNTATAFFNFFSEGESSWKEKGYNADKYYGSIPVSEGRIRSFFKGTIEKDILDTLMAIVKQSNRFIREEDEEGVLKYRLKPQYLLGIPALAVAILYDYGKPMCREEIYERVVELNKRYPLLVEEPHPSSFVLRRKPILSAAGLQGRWTLKIWGEKREHVFDVIRRIVNEEYERNGNKPVAAEVVQSELKALNYDYPLKSVKTYITKANCKSLRSGYLPEDAPVKGQSRKLVGKSYKVQQLAAGHILEERRPLSYSELIALLCEDGMEVSRNTLEQFLHKREDVFIERRTGRNIFINLSSKIINKRDIKEVIAEPLSKEPEYRTNVRNEIVQFLLREGESTQFNLVRLFKGKLPARLKAPDSEIRLILRDEEKFSKRVEGRERIIGLSDIFRQRWLLEHPEPRPEDSVKKSVSYSWEELKYYILQKFYGDFADSDRPLTERDVDNVYTIMACGREFPADSTYKKILKGLYSYLIGSTDFDARDSLRKDMLNAMELYLRNFYYLMFHTAFSTPAEPQKEGLGKIRYELQSQNFLPNSKQENLSSHEKKICRTVDRLNAVRNKQDHPKERTDFTERKISIDIHDCLVLLLFLARELN
ncbi:MAG: hypothetical protein IKU04_05705 [Bacteroidales bacterium]|nr:hypothetical protein [Bacteroidales bacterium]